jgi:outer membrane lipoprotein LolB
MNFRTQSFFLLLMALLQACSLQPSIDTDQQPSTSLAAMANNHTISQWRLSGKIGIRSQKQSETAYLNWYQCQDNFDIRLSGPLGQGAVHLSGDNTLVHLQTSKGERYSAASAEQLMNQQLGWQLPIAELFYWVRGLPSPSGIAQVNDSGDGFKQSGWQLHFKNPTTQGQYTLPGKVIAIHPQMKITLILKQWDLDAECNDNG